MRNVFLLMMAMACLAVACSRQTMDRDIKADITVKSKSDIAFAGVGFTVDKGVVTLIGTCSAEPAKQKVEGTVKKIAGVKKVMDSIMIAPVVIDTDPALKQSVDSALMQFNLATSQVSNNNVVLIGKVKKQDDVQKILDAMQKIKAGNVDNRLVVE